MAGIFDPAIFDPAIFHIGTAVTPTAPVINSFDVSAAFAADMRPLKGPVLVHRQVVRAIRRGEREARDLKAGRHLTSEQARKRTRLQKELQAALAKAKAAERALAAAMKAAA